MRAPRRHGLRAVLAVGVLAALWLGLACAPAAGPTASRPPSASAPVGDSAATAPAPAGQAPLSPPEGLRIGYSELTRGQTDTWVGYKAGIFAWHGLEVGLSYIASAQTIAAVLAGETDLAIGGGSSAINSRLGGSELLMFLGVTDWYPYEFMVTPDVNGPADLRGKTIGISRFGASSDIATRVALRHLGLDPERDVTIIQTGSIQERIAAMRAGAVAGGMVSPPQDTLMRRMGFKSLLDLSATGEKELTNAAYGTATWLRANEATAQAFTNAMLEAVHYAKNNRELTERVIGQYLKLEDPEALADSYEHYVAQNLSRTLEVPREAVRKYLEIQAATDPRAAGARAEDFIDPRFVERAVASGLIQRLYGNQ